MATNEYNFKSIAESEYLEEVPETATVLVEDNGSIKRVPGSGLGGIKTAIIKDNAYDLFLNGETIPDDFQYELECVNMTFEQAWDILKSGQMLNVDTFFHYEGVGAPSHCSFVKFGEFNGLKMIVVFIPNLEMSVYWTADGVSTEPPTTE